MLIQFNEISVVCWLEWSIELQSNPQFAGSKYSNKKLTQRNQSTSESVGSKSPKKAEINQCTIDDEF